MAVIIKDFQVVTEKPVFQIEMSPPSEIEQGKAGPPPQPKKMAQTLHHLKQRLARVHAD